MTKIPMQNIEYPSKTDQFGWRDAVCFKGKQWEAKKKQNEALIEMRRKEV